MSNWLFGVGLTFSGFGLAVLLGDNEWSHKLSWIVPVSFTLAAVSFLLCVPAVRRWLGGHSGRDTGGPAPPLQHETGSVRVQEGSQSVIGSGNKTAGGNFEEHHHHSYTPAPIEEVPMGEKNGINRDFVLRYAPKPESSFQLFLNGLKQDSEWYTLNGKIVTFTVAPKQRDSIEARYTQR